MSVAELKRENAKLKRENAELKAANLKLENQVKLLHAIFDNLSEGAVATTLEGEFLLANPAAQEMVGMGPTDGSPEEWSEIYGTFYPDKVTLVPSTELPLYKAMQGEVTDDVKLFIRNKHRPDGVFINVSGRPLYDETDNLIGGVITISDITELESITDQLETTLTNLQTQNALMDAIFNSIGDGIVVVDDQGKYILFNETAKKILGQNPERIRLAEASERFGLFKPGSQEFYPTDELPIARARLGEKVDDVEILVRNPQVPDGIAVNSSARPIYGKNGVVRGGVCVIHDISERKIAENQLRAMNDQLTSQSQLLTSIFDSMSDGVFVIDNMGRILMTNASAMEIVHGMSLMVDTDECPVMEDMNLLTPMDQLFQDYQFFYTDGVTPFPMDELPILSAIRGESVNNVEMFIRTPSRPEGIYLSASGRPLQDGDGNRTGGVSTFRDVSDRINREEAVTQAFSQGRLEVVDTILHNIGNAINSVVVGVETVNERLTNDQLVPRFTAMAAALKAHEADLSAYIESDPQGQKILPLIHALSHDFEVMHQELMNTIGRIRERTRHVVDIIRTQNSYQGTSRIHKDVNLAEVISDAIEMLQDSMEKRQIQVGIDCDNALQEVRIQESQFHQMLVNLIKNAIEAIDGLIKLGELDEVPRIQVRGYMSDDSLHVDVTDNGIGIAPENINKIFSAGFTTKEGGSGLGLHSSANFVMSLGGKIQALSEGIGKGTTIRIIF